MSSLARAAALVAALLPLPAAAAAPPSLPPPTGASGSVYVATFPAGAEVYVDGSFVGRSPVLVDALGVGRHGVTITKTGWMLYQSGIEIAAGRVTMQATELVRSPAPNATPPAGSGSLIVRGVPDGTPVAVDGAPISPRTLATSPAGTHRVTIGAGPDRLVRTIAVYADTTTEVLARDGRSDLAPPPAHGTSPAPHAAAIVAPIDEWLPDATVSFDGKKITLRYAGHLVEARLGEVEEIVDGEHLSYEGPPQRIAGRFYLPLALLQRLSGNVVRAGGKS